MRKKRDNVGLRFVSKCRSLSLEICTSPQNRVAICPKNITVVFYVILSYHTLQDRVAICPKTIDNNPLQDTKIPSAPLLLFSCHVR